MTDESDTPALPEVMYVGPCRTCGTPRYISLLGTLEQRSALVAQAKAQTTCVHCRRVDL